MIGIRPFYLRPFYLRRISVITIAVYFFRLLKRATTTMALLTAPQPPPPSPRWLEEKEDENPQFSQRRRNSPEVGPEDVPIVVGGVVNEVVIRPMKKRPARLVVPTSFAGLDFTDKMKKVDSTNEAEVIKGRDFFIVSKKGKREFMEDRHAAVVDISGDPKQAFFVVIDGHGGHAAAEYVAENLGKNIINELEGVVKAGIQIEAALRGGYSATDKQFLAKDVNGGACAAGVLLKDGKLHVANVGDCRVVLSKKGKAITLTNDHRLSREDERARIENSGGYLHCHNGVWRVNGSLAVSRAFGDLHLKDWIISDPDIVTVPLTSDCEFVIVASDGLWDKVSEQEAVDVFLSEKNSLDSCRKLTDISSSRGNRDDITVMKIDLHNFMSSTA